MAFKFPPIYLRNRLALRVVDPSVTEDLGPDFRDASPKRPAPFRRLDDESAVLVRHYLFLEFAGADIPESHDKDMTQVIRI